MDPDAVAHALWDMIKDRARYYLESESVASERLLNDERKDSDWDYVFVGADIGTGWVITQMHLLEIWFCTPTIKQIMKFASWSDMEAPIARLEDFIGIVGNPLA